MYVAYVPEVYAPIINLNRKAYTLYIVHVWDIHLLLYLSIFTWVIQQCNQVRFRFLTFMHAWNIPSYRITNRKISSILFMHYVNTTPCKTLISLIWNRPIFSFSKKNKLGHKKAILRTMKFKNYVWHQLSVWRTPTPVLFHARTRTS